MLLYQGSVFVRGNRFEDRKGAILTFEKNTKNGKLFSTEDGKKIGLTEGQVLKLKLVEKRLGKGLDDIKKDTDKMSKDGIDSLFTDNKDDSKEAIKKILNGMNFDSDEKLREFVNKIVDEVTGEK